MAIAPPRLAASWDVFAWIGHWRFARHAAVVVAMVLPLERGERRLHPAGSIAVAVRPRHAVEMRRGSAYAGTIGSWLAASRSARPPISARLVPRSLLTAATSTLSVSFDAQKNLNSRRYVGRL